MQMEIKMKILLSTIIILISTACGDNNAVHNEQENTENNKIPLSDPDKIPSSTPRINEHLWPMYSYSADFYVAPVLDTKRYDGFRFAWDGKTMERFTTNCSPTKKTAVILIMGQSNGSNYVEELAESDSQIATVYDGKCWKHADPLLGSQGVRGNVYSYVAKEMLATGKWDRILLVPIAFGGTSVAQWSGGDKVTFISSGIKWAVDAGLTITHIIWHQGEADQLTDKDKYAEDLSTVIKRIRLFGIDAPFYITQVSACTGQDPITPIIDAQKSLVNGIDILLGPNADIYANHTYRWDVCHFNKMGAEALAKDWVEILK